MIHLLDPNTGPNGRGYRIVGEEFLQIGGGRPTIDFDGTPGPIFGFFFGNSGRQILLTAPPRGSAVGPHPVTVSNAGGTSNAVTFTVTQ